jgi:hypothetical protein
LTHDGSSTFFACPVNDNDEWNIYKYKMTEPNRCVQIALSVSCDSYPPQPPKCCDDCSEHDSDCKESCYEKPKPTPSPTPKCCDDCSDHEWECKKTCYERPKHTPSSTPKVCDECHHRDWDCKKICYKKTTTTSSQPTSSHHKITHSHPHYSTATHCGHCEHQDDECRKTCYTTIRSTTTTTTSSTSTSIRRHKPTPKPKPVCVECEGDCDEECEPLFPSVSIITDSRLNKRTESEVAGRQGLHFDEPKHYGKPHCSSCEKDDKECEKICIVVEITTETVICTDCANHEEPHKCRYECVQPHLKPVCCDDCEKEDDSCKKTCYEKPKPKTSATQKSTPTLHPKPGCSECKEEEHECKKTCHQSPKPTSTPKPVCCDDCEEDDWKCEKTCYEKPKPKTTPKPKPTPKSKPKPSPKPVNCGECKEEEHWCVETCYPDSRSSPLPPSPKPTSNPVCCDECKSDDWECIKTCYPPHPTPPKSSSKTWPKPTTPPIPCCHECKHEEFDCHKICEQKCEYQPKVPHSHPSESKSTPIGHAPWYKPAAPSQGNIPGQLYGACPADLNGDYQSPYLIIPVSSAKPNKAYGSSYNAYVSDVKSTIFDFHIPESYQGKTCSLFFMLPNHEDLETSNYSLSGQGSVHFDALFKTATTETTYANQPSKALHLNDFPLAAGTTYWVADHPCPGGESVAFEMSGSGVDLEYFQDWNPSPIGLYIRAC